MTEAEKKNIRHRTRFSKSSWLLIQIFTDVISIITAYFVQYFYRFESGLVATPVKPDFLLIVVTAIVLTCYWIFLFFFAGLYKNWYERAPFDELSVVVKVILFGTCVIIILFYLDGITPSRFLFFLHLFVLTFFTVVGRVLARRLQTKLRYKGIIRFHALIVGTANEAKKLFDDVTIAKSWGYKTLGIVLLDETEFQKWESNGITHDVPVIQLEKDSFNDVLDRYRPDEVLISTDLHNRKLIGEVVEKASDRNIRVKVVPDLYDIFTGQTRALHIYGIPLIEITPQLLKPWEEVFKRFVDIFFSLLVLLIGLPFWLLTALIIKLETNGLVFYKQTRIGKNGKKFLIYKFRSMVRDADKYKQKWTSVNDPRVTVFGRFIRKTHVDEIPQFWCVLKGDMSIVGPRPEQPQFVEQFSKEIPYYKRRLIVRPGITGWWQVKYKPYELNVDEIVNRLKDDFYYIENISIRLDLEIIARTIWIMLKGHGQA